MQAEPDRWNQLEELFFQSLTLPAAQRQSFVDNICKDDLALRKELVSLLRAHDKDSGPLDVAPEFAAGDEGPANSPDFAGTQVGPYRLLRQIGEGGMGSVWLAERADGVMKRKVALKRPLLSWLGPLSENMAQERDILASLEHPNIARLYDAGISSAGQPYLALEYVEGIPITDFCSSQNLDMRQRLELFLQVLDAVQYAHAHLIIHRDIKPSNVLVSTAGRVHLLDFGIAKLLQRDFSEEGSTEGVAALTPDYASPEQFRGDAVSTASDVYSLGIVLYELLTGSRPYRLKAGSAATRAQALTQIRVPALSEAAANPSIKRRSHDDVEAIIGKAIRHQPAERYASADALAVDIKRYLKNEPVSAVSDSWGYRARKFAVRNRWQTLSVTVAALALVGGAAVALRQAHLARIEAARAEQIKSFVLSILDSADSDSGAGATTTAVDLLQAARKRVEDELEGQPAIAAELMAAIGYGLLGQSQMQDGAALLQKAADLSSQVNGPTDPRTISTRAMLGEALYDSGKNADAIALLKSTAQQAHRQRNTHAEIDSLRFLSSAQFDAGDNEAAVAAARAAVAAIPPARSNFDRPALIDAAQAYESLANVLKVARLPGVVDAARSALQYGAMIGGGFEQSIALEARSSLGTGLYREGKVQEGLQELTRVFEDSRKIRGAEHKLTSSAANALGNACIEAEDIVCGLSASKFDYDLFKRNPQEFGPHDGAFAIYLFGTALAAARQYDQALPLISEATQMLIKENGPNAPMTLRWRSMHAFVLARKGDLAQSDQEFEALAGAPFADAEKAANDESLAFLRSRQGRHAESISLAKSAVQGLANYPSKARRGLSFLDWGTALLAAGRAATAVAPLQQAVSLLRESQVPDSPSLVDAKSRLREAEAKAGE